MNNEEKAELICMNIEPPDIDFIEQNYKSALEMAQWKDSKIRDILLLYTKWLDKRGFFREDLQCDFGHQIDTFLEMNK